MPKVSIIMATYNRAHTIKRAIKSVLLQTVTDWELIIIDDGSIDGTRSILNEIKDPRIKILSHNSNRGAAYARNRGLDEMTGEWFTLLDSDDELVPSAFEELLYVPKHIDDSINAVTCNCIDSQTGKLTGYGLEGEQYVDFETLVNKLYGEHWGITKSSLVGNLRFNEDLSGGESIFWYKISNYAKRYYIHKGLRIYHTEGNDRLCKRKPNVELMSREYIALSKEIEYLSILSKYRKHEFEKIFLRIYVTCLMNDKKEVGINLLEKFKNELSYITIFYSKILNIVPKYSLKKMIKIFINLKY